MGLLAEAEKKRELLKKMTKEKKQYIEHIKPEHKKVIHKEIRKARQPIKEVLKEAKHPEAEKKAREYVKTGIEGFDDLFEKGIPKGSAILVCGGAGTGKTIFCLQMLYNAARNGEKCLYMSFEESEERLRQHMEDFGWDYRELEKKGNLLIKRLKPYDISRSVDALLMKSKGELLIEMEPLIIPEGFKPDRVVIDSLSAIAAAFVGREENYRVYAEQLFSFLEKTGATSFSITETEQIPTRLLTKTGVEEFLADGVIVMYYIRKGDVRENAIEVLKLRGAKHLNKIVAMQIIGGQGIEVYPAQKVFGGLGVKEAAPS